MPDLMAATRPHTAWPRSREYVMLILSLSYGNPILEAPLQDSEPVEEWDCRFGFPSSRGHKFLVR